MVFKEPLKPRSTSRGYVAYVQTSAPVDMSSVLLWNFCQRRMVFFLERERERGQPVVYNRICIMYYVPSIQNIHKDKTQ